MVARRVRKRPRGRVMRRKGASHANYFRLACDPSIAIACSPAPEGHGHIRGMRRDVRLRGAQDDQLAMIAFARGASAARHALVARRGMGVGRPR